MTKLLSKHLLEMKKLFLQRLVEVKKLFSYNNVVILAKPDQSV